MLELANCCCAIIGREKKKKEKKERKKAKREAKAASPLYSALPAKKKENAREEVWRNQSNLFLP